MTIDARTNHAYSKFYKLCKKTYDAHGACACSAVRCACYRTSHAPEGFLSYQKTEYRMVPPAIMAPPVEL